MYALVLEGILVNFTFSCVFKRRLLSSASAADAATPMILHNVCLAPLRTIGFPDFMLLLRK